MVVSPRFVILFLCPLASVSSTTSLPFSIQTFSLISERPLFFGFVMVGYIANGVPVGIARLLMRVVVFYSIRACIGLKTPRREIKDWIAF